MKFPKLLLSLFLLTSFSLADNVVIDSTIIPPKGVIWFAGWENEPREIKDSVIIRKYKDKEGTQEIPGTIETVDDNTPVYIEIPENMKYVSFWNDGDYYFAKPMEDDDASYVPSLNGKFNSTAETPNLAKGEFFAVGQMTSESYTQFGISGVKESPRGLLGVFLKEVPPVPEQTPQERLGYDTDLKENPPSIQQSFFIGAVKEFVPIPEGAKRLYLGILDNRFVDNVNGEEGPLKVRCLFTADTLTASIFPRVKTLQTYNTSLDNCIGDTSDYIRWHLNYQSIARQGRGIDYLFSIIGNHLDKIDSFSSIPNHSSINSYLTFGRPTWDSVFCQYTHTRTEPETLEMIISYPQKTFQNFTISNGTAYYFPVLTDSLIDNSLTEFDTLREKIHTTTETREYQTLYTSLYNDSIMVHTQEKDTSLTLFFNKGCEPLSIDSLYFKQGHITPETFSPPFSIESDSAFSFRFRYSFEKQGLYKDTLVIVHDDSIHHEDTREEFAFELFAGNRELEVTDSSFFDQIHDYCYREEDTLFVKNIGNMSLDLDSIGIHEDWCAVWTISMPLTIPADSTFALSFKVSPQTVGEYEDSLIFHSNDGDNPRQAFPFHLNVSAGEASFSATQMNFDTTMITTEDTIPFSLKNTGCYNLTIDSALFLKEGPFSLKPEIRNNIISPTDSLNLEAFFQPEEMKTFEDTLLIYYAPPLIHADTLLFSGEGVSPVLDFQDSLIEFSHPCIHKLSKDTIILENTGNAPLEYSFSFDSSFVSPYDESIFRIIPSQGNIQAKTEETFEIRFQPDTVDITLPNLVLNTNVPSRPKDTLSIIQDSVNAQIFLSVYETGDDLIFPSSGGPFNPVDTFFTIHNPGCNQLVIHDSTISMKEWFSIQYDPHFINSGDSLTIHLQFDPKGDTTTRESQLKLFNNDPHLPEFILNLTGTTGHAQATYNQEEIVFEETCIFSPIKDTLSLNNTGDLPLIITEMTLFNQAFDYQLGNNTTFPLELAPEESLSIEVEFHPEETGDYEGELLVVSNSLETTDDHYDKFTVSGSASGQEIHLSEEAYTFETFSISSIEEKTFTIVNRGCYPLTLQSVALENDRAFHFSHSIDPGSVIESGASDSVIIYYKPDSTGSHSDVIEILSDDPENPQKEIQLNGGLSENVFNQVKVYPQICTPNNDQINDIIEFRFFDKAHPASTIRIFSKQGVLVKEIKLTDNDWYKWDGKDKDGDLAAPGVYLYYIRDGKSVYQKGSLLIVY